MAVAVTGNDSSIVEQATRNYRAFQSDLPPQFTIAVSLDNVAPPFEQRVIGATRAISSGAGYHAVIDLTTRVAHLASRPERVSAALEETLRVSSILLAFAAGGLIVHAAGIAFGEQGFLFMGPSGTGKTTVARLRPASAQLLNDDLVLVIPGKAGWEIHATPFSNPTQLPPGGPYRAVLTQVLYLVQAPHHAVQAISAARSLAAFAAQVPLLTSDAICAPLALRRAQAILTSVPAAQLDFLPDAGFWTLLNIGEK